MRDDAAELPVDARNFDSLRFDGRCAIVTGAGAGLGRAYALWLAARGCAVVVNGRAGANGSSTATAVAAEITAAGGRAIAYVGGVEQPASGAEMVALATEHFGGPDILVCNAGIQCWTDFAAMPLTEIRQFVDVNLLGTLYPIHAAWPGMIARGYGRIVLTGSGAGLWGQVKSVHYCATKAATIGIARGLAADVPAGADIRINTIAPAAYTALSSSVGAEWAEYMSPMRVAPVVGWLSHRSCTESGMILHTGAGRLQRVRLLQTEAVEFETLPATEVPARLAGPPELASSYAGGGELMPEMVAAKRAQRQGGGA